MNDTFGFTADPEDRDVVIAVMESLLPLLAPLAPLNADRRRRVVDDVFRVMRAAAAQQRSEKPRIAPPEPFPAFADVAIDDLTDEEQDDFLDIIGLKTETER